MTSDRYGDWLGLSEDELGDSNPNDTYTLDYQCPKCGKYFGKGVEAQKRLNRHYQMHETEENQDTLKKFRDR
jgi:hypothetical protein